MENTRFDQHGRAVSDRGMCIAPPERAKLDLAAAVGSSTTDLVAAWRRTGDPADLVRLSGVPESSSAPTRVVGETTSWRMQSAFGSSVSIIGQAARELTDTIAESSQGTINVEFLAPGAGVPPLEAVSAVRSGTIDAAITAPGYESGRYPHMAVFSGTPFGLDIQDTLKWYLSGDYDRDLNEALGDGVVAMACGATGAEAGGWYKRHIEAISDYDGLRIRFFGLGAKVARELGASTQLLAGRDIYPALERGIIDATEFSNPSIDVDYGFHQIRKKYHYPSWHQPASVLMLVVNSLRWRALSDSQKEALHHACERSTIEMANEDYRRSRVALKRFQDSYGVDIRPFPNSVLDSVRAA